MFNIRQANGEDAALISRIIASSWRGAYQELLDPVYLARLPEEYWLPSMRSWLLSGRMYGYIAEQDGWPVGCIIFGRGRDVDYADWGEIVSLYLLPESMGKGIGSALLQKALHDLAEDGYTQVYLWSIQGNDRTERFYQRHGFSLSSDRVNYKVGNGDVTDIRLVREG